MTMVAMESQVVFTSLTLVIFSTFQIMLIQMDSLGIFKVLSM